MGDQRVSRRGVIAGLGAAGAAGLVMGTTGVASAGGPPDEGPGEPRGSSEVSLEGVSLPSPRVLTLNTLQFQPLSAAPYTYVSPGGLASAAGEFWACPVDLPPGSIIQSVSLYLNTNGVAEDYDLRRFNGAVPAFTNVANAIATATVGVQTVTAASINELVLAPPWAYRITNLTLSAGQALYGGHLTYLPPPHGFIPVSPIPRVVNTRDLGQPKLAGGEERIVDLSGYIPATAQAAVVNLTVTQTEVAGFVALFAADVAWPGNSNINWFATNQSFGNMAIVEIDSLARIKMRGGANPTHVIIDVLGYLAP
jgi:hypothetical protein